ncbi:MAG: CHAP domain-containing protein [Oscillospiraceae bacterium]|nr:CHAP domain-containing protein [Oscillospiraceae bacterium]
MMKRIICGVFACLLVLPTLFGKAQAASGGSSANLISTALTQLDYEEEPYSYSKYGEWFGVPRGDWCDMFVSWCANQAGLSTSVFPRSAGCTTHVRLFGKSSPYYVSTARGGSYVPQQGDVIFFYNYVDYPKANVIRHVGIVLCVENRYVFTVEGNTLTNRLDYPYYECVDPLRDVSLEPNDYVAVKCYPLDEPQIHGYAVPNYGDRNAFEHDGWVDLGKYAPLREIFDTLSAQDIMLGTSPYTFSPRYGMTRGDFLAIVMKLYGLSGWEAETEPFDDVPESSTYYDAAMTARSASIVNGTGCNMFKPNIYISGTEAQAIISRTLAYVGQEDQQFDFSKGDFSYMLTPYTIRADIAKALYALLSKMSTPTVSSAKVLLNGDPLDWPMLIIGGSNYVPLKVLSQVFPELGTVPDLQAEEFAEEHRADNRSAYGSIGAANQDSVNDEATDELLRNQASYLPVPMYHTNRVFLSDIPLCSNDAFANVPSFIYQGIQYVMLRPAMNLLNVDVQWNGESKTIELFPLR